MHMFRWKRQEVGVCLIACSTQYTAYSTWHIVTHQIYTRTYVPGINVLSNQWWHYRIVLVSQFVCEQIYELLTGEAAGTTFVADAETARERLQMSQMHG